jgi:KDO2-lipid IV(A) lauroyltransferase
LRNLLEFLPAWLLLKALGLLPRSAAIFIGKLTARVVYYLHGRLRHTAHRNLAMAMPEMGADERVRVIKGVFRNLGRLLGEFSQFPKLTPENIDQIVIYDGLENYKSAAERGRGVLLLTGHVGSWELCAFAQGLYGYPLSFLVRLLDNPLINRMANHHRELSGNRTINKMMAVKPVLETLKRGGDVGLLIDVNVLSDQGIFCDFFGIPASSTMGLAVFALRADAPVVPGFLIWDERLKKHRLRFDPEIPLVRTGDFKEEVRINTERFTRVVEEYVRRYPDQWLWIHKRWKTRPQEEPDLYGPDEPARSSRSQAKVGAEA